MQDLFYTIVRRVVYLCEDKTGPKYFLCERLKGYMNSCLEMENITECVTGTVIIYLKFLINFIILKCEWTMFELGCKKIQKIF